MITYLISHWDTVLTAYIFGFFGWCAVMSLQLSDADREYFLSALIWPVMLIHVISVRLRLLIAPPKGRR